MNGSNIISAIHHIKLSKEFFNDFIREAAGSKGEQHFKKYIGKLDWILLDIITIPALPQIVRDSMRKEFNSDVFSVTAINEKIPLLNAEHREQVEDLIEKLLNKEKCL